MATKQYSRNIALPELSERELPVTWERVSHSDGFAWFSNDLELLGRLTNSPSCMLRFGYLENEEIRGFLIQMYHTSDDGVTLLTEQAIPCVDISKERAEVETIAVALGLMRKASELVELES